jgi:hypothetical protein
VGDRVTVADLVAVLEADGLRVAAPGDNTTALPCVVLSPVSLELRPGGRLLYQVVDICPSVPLTPRLQRNEEAFDLAVRVYRALAGTEYQYATEAHHEEDPDHQPPSMFYRINVRFAGPDLCQPKPEPDPELVLEPLGV